MRKYVLFFALIFSLLSERAFSQTSDSTVNALLAIDEGQFINKPLDSIIALLPPGYIDIRIIHGGHRYTARKLKFLYPNRVWIDLHVREFNFMNPLDTSQVWNITLMRKEKLYKTVIYKHVNCYRNCDVY
ncbi:MAG: hypothetical protein JNM88_00440 [Chitinophagaceae bacterium]|nr:hypothetical protein [Chitinophagaceae bacterium]